MLKFGPPVLGLVGAALIALSLCPATDAQAQSSGMIKQCADRWNDMKARDQTGDLTYRQFSQSCMAGTAPAPKPTSATGTKPATTTTSRTSVPSAGSRSSPPVVAQEEDDETDKEALTRCNGEWKAYKAKNNLTGAKAWHVFMAKCL